MAARADLLSTMKPMPTFTETEQVTEKNIIRHNDDGTISVIPKGEIAEYADVDHDEETPEGWNDNLAEELSPQERIAIADELIEYYEIDEQVREEHFERLTDGLRLMGLTDEPASDVPFKGAATVQHPLIAEAVTQFQARAIEEFFPPQGPVKAYIMGEATDEKVEQGKRLEDYMNYQLTEADEEYFWSTDQMLFYLPLSGSAFKKVYIDPITGMTTSRFVTAEDFIVPYHARTLANAPRYCHKYEMPENDVFRAQEAGSFIADARLLPTPQILVDKNTSFSRYDLEDVADDRSPQQHYDDTIYTMLEYHIDYRMPWDEDSDIAPPYVVTVEAESREVMAVRRNWKHDDPLMKKRIWFTHYKYLPGLGFYGFGLLHIIGSLAKAVSGGIRALLDSAAVANLQGGFKSKEAKIAGEIRFTPGEWIDVDMSADELEKAFFNLPVKEPSTALANLVQTLVDEGRRFATTTENMVGDASNTGPVGTTLALIEQGSKVFSGIHKRMHVSARQEFKMMSQLNYEFMDVEEYPYEVQGEERSILKSDFDGRVDIIPVSDPNIWSATQRIAQNQAVLELITADPELYPKKQRKIAHRRMFEAMRIPDIDQILPEDKDAPLDPVSENMSFMVGSAVTVYPLQDHDAHIAVHTNFAQQQAAENPDLVANLEPVIQAHIMEHKAYVYRAQVEAELGTQLPYINLDDPADNEDLPPELEKLISQAVAKKLKPPPPPAPSPEEQAEQDEKQRQEDEADLETIGKIERGRAETAAGIDRKDEESDAGEKRLDKESDAEGKRKDTESRAEVRRLDKKARAQATFGKGPVSVPKGKTGKQRKKKRGTSKS
jgi:hypothetical protein